jgi:hypothetical protein
LDLVHLELFYQLQDVERLPLFQVPEMIKLLHSQLEVLKMPGGKYHKVLNISKLERDM